MKPVLTKGPVRKFYGDLAGPICRNGIWNGHKTNKNIGPGEANLLFTFSAATERQCETRVIFLVAI